MYIHRPVLITYTNNVVYIMCKTTDEAWYTFPIIISCMYKQQNQTQ